MIAAMDLSISPDTIMALLTLAGVVFASVYSAKGHSKADAANRAVNGRGAGEPVLYDMVRETRDRVGGLEEWRNSYRNGPLDTGDKVNAFVTGIDDLGKIVRKFDATAKELKEDVMRYGCPVRLGTAKETECLNR
jgi:hypothetical protein